MLRWISGTSNRILAYSCLNEFGQFVEPERFEAIFRWDRVEDADNDFYDRAGRVPPGRLSERYCIRDMLDNDLDHRQMERYGTPTIGVNLDEQVRRSSSLPRHPIEGWETDG